MNYWPLPAPLWSLQTFHLLYIYKICQSVRKLTSRFMGSTSVLLWSYQVFSILVIISHTVLRPWFTSKTNRFRGEGLNPLVKSAPLGFIPLADPISPGRYRPGSNFLWQLSDTYSYLLLQLYVISPSEAVFSTCLDQLSELPIYSPVWLIMTSWMNNLRYLQSWMFLVQFAISWQQVYNHSKKLYINVSLSRAWVSPHCIAIATLFIATVTHVPILCKIACRKILMQPAKGECL